MARIVKVEADMVSIGMPDGSLVTVPRSEIPFSVKEGMAVEAYRDETGHVLVTRGSSKRVSKIIYILLAVFLDNFGIHRFYAGHTVAGICYLVATGIGALLAFIGIGLILEGIVWLVCLYDAIKAAFKTSDAEGRIEI